MLEGFTWDYVWLGLVLIIAGSFLAAFIQCEQEARERRRRQRELQGRN